MPIFDQGYQHWRGPLSGRLWRWMTISRQGVRVQRKSWMVRLVLLTAWLPALALVGAMVLWGFVERRNEGVLALVRGILPPDVLQDPQAYRGTVWTLAYSFFFKFEMYFIMLLVAIAGPGLISQDLRFNALPMYLGRPLTRLDYFLGKLGVIGALVLSVAVGPALFAYLVGLCFCLDLSAVKDTYTVLLGSLAYGLIITLSAGTLILALSSLTKRSLYVGITWAGLWIISSVVAQTMTDIHRQSLQRELEVQEMNRWMAENPLPEGAQTSQHGGRTYPSMRIDPKTHKRQLIGLRPDREAAGERWMRRYAQAQARIWAKMQTDQLTVMRGDWRPICSYVANLERFADLLLDTESAWVSIGRADENARRAAFQRGFGAAPFGRAGPRTLPSSNERQFADQMVLQYPWWWSAGVLAGLLGLSIWILTRRIKSLDRLR
ncbi:MAG: ABC transporter permease [Gemmataceae bacterium]